MKTLGVIYVLSVILVLSACVYGQNNDTTTQDNPTTHGNPTTRPPVKTTKPSTDVTTTPSPTIEEVCQSLNSSCSSCTKNAKCLWCNSGNKCVPYPTGQIIPHSSVCPLDHARWGVCWVNFKILIITMSVIGGLLILSVVICICCCCCKKNNSAKYDKEDAKFERRKMDRKAKNDEKRAERRAKTDEIRRKYGLIKEDNPYQRFDDA